MSYSIILPTLNEEGHIIELIEEISKNFTNREIPYEIIVVDDNSTDGTIDKIKKFSKSTNIDISLHVRDEKKNLANSINYGITMSKYKYVIWMDADFQHPPQYIKKFLELINNYDLIIFSRFLNESKRYFDKNTAVKEFNEDQSIIFNKLSNLLLFKDITDYTSGYICIRQDLIKNFKLRGFYGEYFVDLIVNCKLKKYKILELPFEENERKTGFSKTMGINKIRYAITIYFYFMAFIKNCLKVISKI